MYLKGPSHFQKGKVEYFPCMIQKVLLFVFFIPKAKLNNCSLVALGFGQFKPLMGFRGVVFR